MTESPTKSTGEHSGFSPNEIAALRLSMVSGIGPKTYMGLISRFGSPPAVLSASRDDLFDVPGVGKKLCEELLRAHEIDVKPEIERCQKHQIKLLGRDHPNYPARLKEIDDSPVLLYCRGELLPQDSIAIAIVGSRHATQYGLRQSNRFAYNLAMAGFTIISGLARGVDAAAHRGALEAKGRTIAILGSGLLNLYPPDHAELSLEISKSGALLSEAPTLAPPRSGTFPQRNRLITGMSLGVIVVEAAERSGALISARHASEQGREVFAIPGPIDSRMSRGCHRLIRDGAKLVETIDDVIEELGPLATPTRLSEKQTIHHPAELKLNEQETRVLNAISSEPTSVDSIVEATNLPVHRVLATISVLEIRRLVRKISGSSVVRY
ncbi:MAG TPA: DNA-processing protein DprA [Pirellulaceae bacterium]|nr:DNA-processing protein DprA [Pirellulaceae bacterium]HMO93185.1 DNA-processing protein DprA [Pirellulaceae bacterium]HMP69986.1 DNA-processing protein DprA [Pirellulaceae bacterium]